MFKQVFDFVLMPDADVRVYRAVRVWGCIKASMRICRGTGFAACCCVGDFFDRMTAYVFQTAFLRNRRGDAACFAVIWVRRRQVLNNGLFPQGNIMEAARSSNEVNEYIALCGPLEIGRTCRKRRINAAKRVDCRSTCRATAKPNP